MCSRWLRTPKQRRPRSWLDKILRCSLQVLVLLHEVCDCQSLVPKGVDAGEETEIRDRHDQSVGADDKDGSQHEKGA